MSEQPKPRVIIQRVRPSASSKKKYEIHRTKGECVVCTEEDQELISPKDYEKDSCSHSLCEKCWRETGERNPACPMCRKDLRSWMTNILKINIETKEAYDEDDSIPEELMQDVMRFDILNMILQTFGPPCDCPNCMGAIQVISIPYNYQSNIPDSEGHYPDSEGHYPDSEGQYPNPPGHLVLPMVSHTSTRVPRRNNPSPVTYPSWQPPRGEIQRPIRGEPASSSGSAPPLPINNMNRTRNYANPGNISSITVPNNNVSTTPITYPNGDPNNPYSWGEVIDGRFHCACGSVVTAGGARRHIGTQRHTNWANSQL